MALTKKGKLKQGLKKRKAAHEPEAQSKASRTQERAQKEEVDLMNPPPAGDGHPRACRWMGLEAPFHDGGGLASPGRRRQRSRKTPKGARTAAAAAATNSHSTLTTTARANHTHKLRETAMDYIQSKQPGSVQRSASNTPPHPSPAARMAQESILRSTAYHRQKPAPSFAQTATTPSAHLSHVTACWHACL